MRNKRFEGDFFNDHLFFIMTPMIEELVSQLNRWIWIGATGAYIHGMYRVGKTTMVRQVSELLENRIGERIPVFSMSMPKRDTHTIANVYRNLCFGLSLNVEHCKNSDVMRNLVFNHLGEAALITSTKQVVLFVDEMQFLNVKQLHVFAEVFNLLKADNVNLIVFSVGNTNECKPLITKVRNSYKFLSGRFYHRETKFRGISTKSQLVTCLKQYDETLFQHYEFPCTAYFLPQEYASGWRLVSIASPIWSAFCDFKKKHRMDSWPMQYFSDTIKILLADFLRKYPERDDSAIYKMTVNAIEETYLVQQAENTESASQ